MGDETALPAITRRLDELPATTQAIVIVRVSDVADQKALTSHAALDVAWVANDAASITAVRALLLPTGQGYAWCVGDAAATAELRRILVNDKGHDRHAIRAAAYWKRGTDWENIGTHLRKHLDRHGIERVTIHVDRGAQATHLDPDDPWVVWAVDSLRRSTGKAPAVLPNLGGTLPNDVFAKTLNLPTIWVPHSYPASTPWSLRP